MLVFNLLILFMVIILSYVFKVSQTKKYDTQLVFILLSFTILVLYKSLNYIYNKKVRETTAVKHLSEYFTGNTTALNNFISDTLSNEEKIRILEAELNRYRTSYGVNNILDNNLEYKIAELNEAKNKLAHEYNTDVANNPTGDGLQISVDTEKGDISLSSSSATQNVNTDAVKQVISRFLASLQTNGEINVSI